MQLGPYQIGDKLGAGGMGIVYRARDTRLDRDVAVKVLPPDLRRDPERLRRFAEEARAAGTLNHPNIVAVHDVSLGGDGAGDDEAPYLVTELLEGDTLRDRLTAGPIPRRKALDYAVQLAEGLAAAHDKGVVHRDLKPENLFITVDGRLKILDFGIAKLSRVTGGDPVREETATGAIVGTVDYMSPEQVRGRPADHRSDLFSFGAILHEMLTGARAFACGSALETGYAILNKEPLGETHGAAAPELERIVRRCLEKNPAERFQSAHDLAFHLQATTATGTMPALSDAPSASSRPRWRMVGLVVLALVVSNLAVYRLSRPREQPAAAIVAPPVAPPAVVEPTYQRVTFRRGPVRTARFVPHERSLVYSAEWDGEALQTYEALPGGADARPIGPPGMMMLDVSSKGEMAVLLLPPLTESATLARMPVAGGGEPRAIAENMGEATWDPAGDELAAVRYLDGRAQLEYPIGGKPLYVTTLPISSPRFSADGRHIAFVEHPLYDSRGHVMVVAVAGGDARRLSREYTLSVEGLAWGPDGDVWFTAADQGAGRTVRAVSLAGVEREVERAPGNLILLDIAADGRVLISRPEISAAVVGLFAGETRERDISWVDAPITTDLGPDGRTMVFWSMGEVAGTGATIYLWRTGAAPARLGDGFSGGMSADGRWVVGIAPAYDRLALIPTGVGDERVLPAGPVRRYEINPSPRFTPDGTRVLYCASEADHSQRVWVSTADGKGAPRAVTPEGECGASLWSDGQHVLGFAPDGTPTLLPLDGGPAEKIPGTRPGDVPLRFTADGKSLYLAQDLAVSGFAARDRVLDLWRVDLATGKRTAWRKLVPAFAPGLSDAFLKVVIDPDGKYYAYSYSRVFEVLYLATGL